MEATLFERLERVQEEFPTMIPEDVCVSEEYGVYRSFRRGATSEATNRGVPAEVIEINNRWRMVEHAKTSHPSLTMRAHYTDIRLVLKQLLRFSEEL